jgi:hypothetical protein
VIRFPHPNPDYFAVFLLVIGSARRALSSRNLRRIGLAIIGIDIYLPWNDEVVFDEEFALRVMYGGHGLVQEQQKK